MTNYFLIGKIGLTNITVLLGITVFRFVRWYQQWDNPETWTNSIFKKRFCFHVLLLLSTALDLPMYIQFVCNGDYSLTAYAFHKFQSASLFAALSITISDWATVLHDIHEYDVSHFFLGKVSLVFINTVYFLISFLNFIICFTLENLNAYLNTPYYTTGIFFQISVSFLLTTLMLHAGLKLYMRISGAAGTTSAPQAALGPGTSNSSAKLGLGHRLKIPTQFFRLMNDGLTSTPRESSLHGSSGNNSQNDLVTHEKTSSHTPHNAASQNSYSYSYGYDNSAHSAANLTFSSMVRGPLAAARTPAEEENTFDGTAEFRQALFNLNLVMLACTLCIFLQMVMLILNYALGYANEADQTPGPYLFYWTTYSWIPLWGPICALLYLSRSQSARRKQKQLTSQMMSSLSHSQPSLSSSQFTHTQAGSHTVSNPLISSRTSSDYHFNRQSSADYVFSERERRRGMLSQVLSDDVESSVLASLRNDLALSHYRDTESDLYGYGYDDRETETERETATDRESGAVTIIPGSSPSLSGRNKALSHAQILAEGAQSNRASERNGYGESDTPSSQHAQQHTPVREHDPLRVILSQSLGLSSAAASSSQRTRTRTHSQPQTEMQTHSHTQQQQSHSQRGRERDFSEETGQSYLYDDRALSGCSEDAMRIILGTDTNNNNSNTLREDTERRERARLGGTSFDTQASYDANSSHYAGTVTTAATRLPSEMFFPHIMNDDQRDFSYRGEETERGTNPSNHSSPFTSVCRNQSTSSRFMSLEIVNEEEE